MSFHYFEKMVVAPIDGEQIGRKANDKLYDQPENIQIQQRQFYGIFYFFFVFIISCNNLRTHIIL